MNNELMFSSKEISWNTPQELFLELNQIFNFDLDPCATAESAKCLKFFF